MFTSNKLTSTIGGKQRTGPIKHHVTSVKYNKEKSKIITIINSFDRKKN